MQRNTITRRKFLRGVAATGLGVVGMQIMAACGGGAPAASNGATPATGSSAAPAATDVVLRVQAAPEGGQAVMPTILGERFQADTGVEVVIEETIYGEIETKTQTGFISNTLQDLLYGHHRWLFINFLKGIYLPIDDLLASDPPEDYDDIYPSIMAGNSLDGQNFSFPGVTHPGGNISVNYNKTMLEEKGLPLPQEGWTLSDWTELAKSAADPANGIFGLGFEGMNSFHYYSNISRSFGSPDSNDGELMNADGTQFQYDTPLHAEVAAWYTDLLENRAWLYDHGRGICNCIYVDNLVHAITCCLNAADDAAGVYLVGDAETVTWEQFYRAAALQLEVSPGTIQQVTEVPSFERSWQDRASGASTHPFVQRLLPLVPHGLKRSAKAMIAATSPKRPTDSWTLPARARPRITQELALLQQCAWKFPHVRAEQNLEYRPPVSFAEGMERSFAWWKFAQGQVSFAA